MFPAELSNLNCAKRVVNKNINHPLPPPAYQPTSTLLDPSTKDRGKLLYLLKPVKFDFHCLLHFFGHAEKILSAAKEIPGPLNFRNSPISEELQ